MQAVILAGGLGTRLRPVSYEIPKPLIPVKKEPILNHLLKFLADAGTEDMFVIVNIAEQVDYERWQKTWGDQSWMLLVHLVFEKKRYGTFGALHAVKNILKKETFIISIADSLMQFEISSLLKAHKEFGTVVTTALVPTTDPCEYGLAIMDGNRINRFTTDPSEANSGLISSGFYVAEPALLDKLDEKEQSLHQDILPALASSGEYAGLVMANSRFYECGTLERWKKAIKEW